MKTLVLKVGGSLLSKSDEKIFDFVYFRELRKLLLEITENDTKIAMSVGGGFVARKYQGLASRGGEQDVEDIHKIGVAVTNINAEITHGLLSDIAVPELIRYEAFEAFINDTSNFDFGEHKILITSPSPSKTGRSNDWNSLQVAKKLGAKEVLNIKNVDGVYSADPKKDPSAHRIDKLTWDEYLDIIGNPTEHKPGANYPIDPIAARDAKENHIKFTVVGGEDLNNVRHLLAGNQFVGTVIE